jgi:hypothetical protein
VKDLSRFSVAFSDLEFDPPTASDRRDRLHSALDRMLDYIYRAYDGAFVEQEHPRGHRGNPGQFVKKGGGAQPAHRQERPSPAHGRTMLARVAKGAVKAGPPVKLTPTTERAWSGGVMPKQSGQKLSKLETGEIGEKAVISWLQAHGEKDARPLNTKNNNYPVDLIHDSEIIEVKSGRADNQKTAQHWRATIGETSDAEKAWIATASREEKAKANEVKSQLIIKRKNDVLAELQKLSGIKVKNMTWTTLVNPETNTIDIYKFPGWHSYIKWTDPGVKDAYIGSFKWKYA